MKTKLLIILILVFFSGHLLAIEKEFVFGVVPQFDARHTQKVWSPVLRELEKKTGFKFRIEGSPTIPAFENQFLSGKFDFAYMNPYHALKAAQSQQYTPLVRDIGRKLHGIIVVNKKSGITSVEQLNNKEVAFPAPNAIGASLIPRAEFARKFKIDIKPKYVQSHSSVYLNVALGRTVAGGGVQKSLSQQKESIRNKLVVIHKTLSFSPHPVVAHKRISKEDRSRVMKAFIEIGKTEEGRTILNRIPIKKIGVATLDDYLPIKELALEEFYEK